MRYPCELGGCERDPRRCERCRFYKAENEVSGVCMRKGPARRRPVFPTVLATDGCQFFDRPRVGCCCGLTPKHASTDA